MTNQRRRAKQQLPLLSSTHGLTDRRRVHAPRAHASAPAQVSIVIPCYNYAEFLPDAATSALQQTGVEVEVIIVDDASTDSSAAVAIGIADADSRVRVVQHSTNRGAVQTFNDGLESVSGEFIVRLDADDMLTPGSLARAVDVARAFPSVGLIYGHPVHFIESHNHREHGDGWGRPVIIPPGTRPPYRSDVRSWTVWPGREWLADRCRTGLNVITSPEVMMRTSVVEKTGGQKPLAHTHDMEMWFRLAAISDVAHIAGADQAWHRDHSASLSTALSGPLAQMRAEQDAFDTLFDGLGTSGEFGKMRRDAQRALARRALREASHALDRGRGDGSSIEAAESFALSIYPESRALREWAGLARRKALGSVWPVHRSPYVIAAALHRLENERDQTRWKRWGY